MASDIMVKDVPDSEGGNLLPPLRGLLFPVSSKECFYVHHSTDRIVTPLVRTRYSSVGPPWRTHLMTKERDVAQR